MSLSLNQSNANKKPVERIGEGTYPARLVQVLDLGKQVETDWQTGEVKTWDDGNTMLKPKVWLTFELPDETIDVDGEAKPRWISKEYNVSFHEKSALTQVVSALNDGKAKTLADLIGQPALVEIGTTRTGKDKLTSVSKVVKGMTVGELQNDPKFFDFDNPNRDIYDNLPNFLQEKIKEGAEHSRATKVSQMIDMPAKPKQEDLGDDDLDF